MSVGVTGVVVQCLTCDRDIHTKPRKNVTEIIVERKTLNKTNKSIKHTA